MISKNIIDENFTLEQALKRLDRVDLKCLVVVSKTKKLVGTLTDGDLRRAILRKNGPSKKVKYFIHRNPIKMRISEIHKNSQKNKIKQIFSNIINKVEIIPVVNNKNQLINLLNKDDFIRTTNSIIKKTKVMIVAGGLGTRLKPFTNILPKPLIPIEDKPMIGHIIDNFKFHGFNKFSISINYKSNLIKSYFNEIQNKSTNIEFVEEKKPLGTIGSLSKLKYNKFEEIIVSNCDILTNINFLSFIEFHRQNKNDLTMVCSLSDFTIPYGVCEIDKNQTFKNMIEKPKIKNFVNIGIYLINSKLIKYIKKNEKIDFDDYLKILRKKKHKIGIYPINQNDWTDLGNLENFKSPRVSEIIKSKKS